MFSAVSMKQRQSWRPCCIRKNTCHSCKTYQTNSKETLHPTIISEVQPLRRQAVNIYYVLEPAQWAKLDHMHVKWIWNSYFHYLQISSYMFYPTAIQNGRGSSHLGNWNQKIFGNITILKTQSERNTNKTIVTIKQNHSPFLQQDILVVSCLHRMGWWPRLSPSAC